MTDINNQMFECIFNEPKLSQWVKSIYLLPTTNVYDNFDGIVVFFHEMNNSDENVLIPEITKQKELKFEIVDRRGDPIRKYNVDIKQIDKVSHFSYDDKTAADMAYYIHGTITD